jgi:glutamyl-tRNA synthetase
MGHGAPAFAHHNLLVGRDGHALSKRDESLSVASLREAGLEPMAVACHAALVGTSDAVEPLASLDELAARLDLARISTAPARFDPAELAALNARLLQRLPYASVARRLAVLEVGGGEPFWLAVRGNLSVLADARTWWRIVADEITPVIEDAGLTKRAAALLPPEPWDEGTWQAWTRAVSVATGAKGRALFHPLRLALTGRETGPELKALLPLIGGTRAQRRLRGLAG